MVVQDDKNGKRVSGTNNDSATLSLPDGRAIELPIVKDIYGKVFVNVERMLGDTGVCTLDQGFGSTASCRSSITYIDGAAGKLYYRGYPVEQLCGNGADVVDLIHLLLHGELPDVNEHTSLGERLCKESLLHEQLLNVYRGFKNDAHPMAILCSAVAALSAFYPYRHGVDSPSSAAVRLIAKMPTLAAVAYKTCVGEPVVYPTRDLGYVANFLHMVFASPTNAPYHVDPTVERAMCIFFVLHADHGQNASTSTVRIAGSSQASPYVCVSSGVASLWGPAHGGANEAVIKMLEDIGTVDRIPHFLERAKDKKDPFRLMGFGHRVYKNVDPRSRVLKDECHRVLERLRVHDPTLEVARALEERARSDPYFVERGLYPNVDFYSGIMLRAMGFPTAMYTVLFAVSRTIGWLSQWKEMVTERATPKIGRPRQVYIGEAPRDLVPLHDRVKKKQGQIRSRL